MKFKKDGITFTAGKGFARAEKDGAELRSAMDAFVEKKPTQEAVLMLHRFFMSGNFDRCYEEAGKCGEF